MYRQKWVVSCLHCTICLETCIAIFIYNARNMKRTRRQGPVLGALQSLAPSLRVADDTNMHAGTSRLPLCGRPNHSTRPQAAVAPFLVIALLRWTEWLLQNHQHCHRAAKGRVKPGRDGAWVSREQLRRSQDPPTHPRGGPIRTYNGCPQPFPSSARCPDARAMHPGKKKMGAAPRWKGRYT